MSATSTPANERPSITKAEIKQELKKLLPFSVNKIGETVGDLLITGLITGFTIAWLATLQNIPVTFGEMTIYIITLFVLIVVMRVIQDFDDHSTVDEVGDMMIELQKQVAEVHRMVKSESTTISDEDLETRLQSIQ